MFLGFWGFTFSCFYVVVQSYIVIVLFSTYRILVKIAFTEQAISPIPAHFSLAWFLCLSVCLSVCHPSHSCTCLKRWTDLNAIWQVHSVGSNDTLCSMGVPDPQGNRRFMVKLSQSIQRSQTVSPTLPPGEQERGLRFRLLPNHFGACLLHLMLFLFHQHS